MLQLINLCCKVYPVQISICFVGINISYSFLLQRETTSRDVAVQTVETRITRSLGRGAGLWCTMDSLPPRGRGRARLACEMAERIFGSTTNVQRIN